MLHYFFCDHEVHKKSLNHEKELKICLMKETLHTHGSDYQTSQLSCGTLAKLLLIEH